MIQVFDTIKDKGIVSFDPSEVVEGFDFSNKWIHMSNPTDKEIELVSTSLSVPEDVIKAALDEEERPRIEREDDYVLTLIDIPTIEENEEDDYYTYSTLPFGFIDNGSAIITVCLSETTLINSFISGKVKNFSVHKKTRFLLQFLYNTATKYLQYLKMIDRSSQRIQAIVEKSMKNKELVQMLDLEKALVYFSTSLRSNAIVLERIPKITTFYQEDEDLWEDVCIENKQATDMSTIYREIMNGTMEAYAALINNNLNGVMKTLTGLTVLIAIPSMIGAFWGMNTWVPWQNQKIGFFIAIGISIIACIITGILMFKKKMLK